MSNKRRQRSSFNRNDRYRSVVTDTSADDVPITFSNDGLWHNLTRHPSTCSDVAAFVEKALLSLGDGYTLPLRYRISHSANSFRQLALPHPASQIRTANLYESYADLLTYYCSRSPFSLRYPAKVASSFFYKNPLADLNKYRDSAVLQEEQDKLFRHPSSYFAYGGGIDRYYKYFDSNEFYSMEKKFKCMLKLDISKCFSSVYTHTISWAIKDIEHGKINSRAISLGNELDRCMQRMNYNETNGIIIGPEFSRIFAEIILQSVDCKISSALKKIQLVSDRDYSIRRYIDDYLIFGDDEATLTKIKSVIAEQLLDVNLHLNEGKTSYFSRPFHTEQSAVVEAAISAFEQFWRGNTTVVELDRRYSYANKIGDHGRLAKSFLKNIKTICHENGTDYGSVSPVLVSAVDERIQRLVDSYDSGVVPEQHRMDQVLLMMALLEVSLFLYSVRPTVSSSYRVGRSGILAIRFCKKHFSEALPVLCEHVLNQCTVFFDQPMNQLNADTKLLPIEHLNLLLSLTELPSEYFCRLLPVVRRIARGKMDYFSIVAVLFAAGRGKLLPSLQSDIDGAVKSIIASGLNPGFSAQDFFVTFDLASCPYLSIKIRAELVEKAMEGLQLSQISKARREQMVEEIQAHPWFTRWDRIDLLRETSRRELNSVY